MTIEKGQPWGAPGALPADGVLVADDSAARRAVEQARRAGKAIPTMGLLGGDLCRTIGGRGDAGRLRSEEATTLPLDVGSVLIDGALHWFVAHLVARRGWWQGRIVAVMNAEWIGGWDVAPRSHPNDGLFDIFDSDLTMGDRWKARSRLRTGTHVPHPGITQRRVAAAQFEFDSPMPIWLDGERVASARRLSVRIEPDAATCVV